MSGAITAVAVTVAAMTAAEIFTAVAITGAVVGAVGAVTHVKELQYAGMALGAVGGIGALAVSAGIFAAEGAALAGLDASGSAIGGGVEAVAGGGWGAASGGAGMADLAATGLPGATAGFEVAPSVIDTVAGTAVPLETSVGVPMSTVEAATSPAVVPDVAMDGTFPGQAMAPNAGGQGDSVLQGGLIDMPASEPMVAQAPTVDPTVPASPTVAVPAEGVTPPAPAAGPVTGAPAGSETLTVGGQPVGVTAAPPPASPWTAPDVKAMATGLGDPGASAWGSIKDFLGKPGGGYLIGGGIQAVGSFLSGAMDPKNEALIRASQAQAASNLAASNLYAEQARKLANEQAAIASGIPVANRRPAVTGAPAGLINSAPRPVVTGVV